MVGRTRCLSGARAGEFRHLTYRAAVRRAFRPALTCMTALVAGVVGFMWWAPMLQLTVLGLSSGVLLSSIAWWALTAGAIGVGWLAVALPMGTSLAMSHK